MVRGKTRGFLLVLATVGAMLWVATAAGAYELDAWGENGWGQLGNGSIFNGSTFAPNEVPAPVVGVSEVIGAAAGRQHSLALLSNGTVLAWGGNSDGQLGNGTYTGPYECHPTVVHEYCNPDPEPVSGLSGVTAVAAAGDHSLALLSSGTLEGWGENYFGELGNGKTGYSDVPVAAGSGLTNVTSIATSEQSSYALVSGGQVMAWGSNSDGSLGDGKYGGSDVPVAVTGVTNAIAIAPAMALLSGDTVVDWGPGEGGQLGNGGTSNSETEVAVSGLTAVSAVAAGYDFKLALRSNGTVWAWGTNWDGQLGDGSSSGPETCSGQACSKTPVEVSGLKNVRAIAAGGDVALALLSSGTVMTWGDGNDTPVAVCGLQSVAGVVAGEGFSLFYGPSHQLCPTVTSLSPDHGPGIGKTSVVITGTNFTGATAVHFGSNSARFTTSSSTSITATAPAGTSGAVPVTVTTPEGTSNAVTASEYEYEVGPAVERVAPHQGPPAGGTEVTVIGANFTKVSAVDFGSTPATKFKVQSANQITALAPPGTGTDQITVVNTEGTSATNSETRFTYKEAEAPEWGTCAKAKKKGTGQFSDANCTVEAAEGDYEWAPGPTKATFSLTGGAATLSTKSSEYIEIDCTSFKGSGEFAGDKEVVGTTLAFKGCKLVALNSYCDSEGATTAGEIKLTEVEGILGWENKATRTVALALGVEMLGSGGQTKLYCGVPLVLGGAVLTTIPADEMSNKLELGYSAYEGTQAVQKFEGGPAQQLEVSFAEYPESPPSPLGLRFEMALKGGKLEVSTYR